MTGIVIAVLAAIGWLALTAAALNAAFGVVAHLTRWKWMLATSWGWVDRAETKVAAAIVLAIAAGANYALGSPGAAACALVFAVYWAVVAARSTRKARP